MRSAQRKKRLKKEVSKARVLGTFIWLVIPLVFILSGFLFIKFTTNYWDGRNKVAFVFQKISGDVRVVILDPELNEKTTLVVPGDTEVTVAHNYGTLRIKNVWQLGINEKLSGDLLTQTVTNNFLFPTSLWAGRDLSSPWGFIFSPGLTNIGFGDRLFMALFSLKVKGIDTTEIDLGKNQFLKKQTLADGDAGYVMTGVISGRLTVYFSDNTFSDSAVTGKNVKFGLIDETDTYGVANKVGLLLEVLGGKVVSVDRRPSEANLDCQVFGKNKDAVAKIARLFACTKTDDPTDFDMIIKMGEKFAKRF